MWREDAGICCSWSTVPTTHLMHVINANLATLSSPRNKGWFRYLRITPIVTCFTKGWYEPAPTRCFRCAVDGQQSIAYYISYVSYLPMSQIQLKYYTEGCANRLFILYHILTPLSKVACRLSPNSVTYHDEVTSIPLSEVSRENSLVSS